MTVVLNEVALSVLLDSQAGPVGQRLDSLANEVVTRARTRVQNIMARSAVVVVDDVDYEITENPLQAIIGIRETGSITRYLARKEGREGGVWLQPSLGEVFS